MIKRTFTFDGKRYYIRGATEREVYEKMALKRRDLEEGRVLLSGSMTVKQWTGICLDTYKAGISEDYLDQMKWRLEKHVLSDIGNHQLKSVKPLQLQAILNRQKGKSKSHITKLKNELYFLFDKAKDNQLILTNPATNLSAPEGYVHTRRSLTSKEDRHWKKVMDQDPRFMLFQLMYYCGCRPSEAAAVLRSDFDTKNGYPRLHIRGTKTINSDRYVPVPLALWEKVKGKSGIIAPNASGTMHSPESLKRLNKRLKRELNISMGCKVYRNELFPPFPLAPDFVPYMFRHTYCTNLQKSGVDIRTARDLMGHADISTTANIYTHQDEDTMKTAAKMVGAM